MPDQGLSQGSHAQQPHSDHSLQIIFLQRTQQCSSPQRILSDEIKLVGKKSSEVTAESDDYVINTTLGCLMALASFLQLNSAKKRLNQVKGAYPCQDTDPSFHGCKQIIFCFTPPMTFLQTGTMWLHWAQISSTPVGLYVPLQHCSISPSSALLSKKLMINRNWSKDLIGLLHLTKSYNCWASAYQDQSLPTPRAQITPQCGV